MHLSGGQGIDRSDLNAKLGSDNPSPAAKCPGDFRGIQNMYHIPSPEVANEQQPSGVIAIPSGLFHGT